MDVDGQSNTEEKVKIRNDILFNDFSISQLLVNSGETRQETQRSYRVTNSESLSSMKNANINKYHGQTTSLTSRIKDTNLVVNSCIVKSEEERNQLFPEEPSGKHHRKENGSLEQEQVSSYKDGRQRGVDGVLSINYLRDNKAEQECTMESTIGVNPGRNSEQKGYRNTATQGCQGSDDVFMPQHNDSAVRKESGEAETELENNNHIHKENAAFKSHNEDGLIMHFETTRKARISVVVSSEAPSNPPQPEKRLRRVTIASYPNNSLKSDAVSARCRSTTLVSTHTIRESTSQGGLGGSNNISVSKSTPCLHNASSQVSLRVEDGQNFIKRKLSSLSNPSASIQALRKKYTNSTSGAMKMKQDRKAVRTLLIVVGTFVLCWLPHFVGIFCLTTNRCNWPDRYFAITTWLAMMNSGCNPVIYGAMSRQFRKRFRQILQCKRGFF
jgi:hypothetical protein